MRRRICDRLKIPAALLLAVTMLAVSVMAASEGFFPFMPKVSRDNWTDDTYAESAASVRSLVLDAPAGKYGHVQAKDGQFVFADTGERIRFWGVNMAFSANFPATPQRAEELAEDFADMGINLVRLHGFDSSNSARASIFKDYANNTTEFDPVQLDRLDYFVAALKERGIYVNINLACKRVFTAGDGVESPKKVSSGGEWKPVQLLDDQLIGLQKGYAEQLLTHINPYTGLSYAQDPAVAMIELVNESSLFRCWYEKKLDSLNERYSSVLKQKWNDWLLEKYENDEELTAAWNQLPQTENFLENPGFEDEDTSMYAMEITNKAKAVFSRDIGFATEGEASMKIEVESGGRHQNYVAFYQQGISLEKGKRYMVSFDAKATTTWPVSVSIRLPKSPYTLYGGLGKCTVTTVPQSFSFTFTSTGTASGLAFFARMGNVQGTFWFDNLQVQEAPAGNADLSKTYGLGEQEWVRNSEKNSYPEPALLDFGEFLRDVEKDTFGELRRYLREDLGVVAPISGNNLHAGIADLSAQAEMDFTGGHAYFDHPTFIIPWSQSLFSVTNESMVATGMGTNTSKSNMYGLLAMTALKGKPYVAGEWNIAFPNPYEYEALILTAAMASIQDWDAMLLFAYSHSDGNDNGAINEWLDMRNNPAKRAQMGAAALLFIRGDIAPANSRFVMDYTREDTARNGLLNIFKYTFFSDAEPTSSMLVDTILERGDFDAEETTSVAASFDAEYLQQAKTRTVHQSANGQFVWNVSAKGAEYAAVNTPRFQSFIGFVGGQKKTADNLTVELAADNHATVTLASWDGAELFRSDRMLLTVCGQQENEGQKRLGSGLSNWGSGSVNVQRIVGEIAVALEEPDAYTVYPMAQDGTRLEAIEAVAADKELRFGLDADTLWYEIVRKADGQAPESPDRLVAEPAFIELEPEETQQIEVRLGENDPPKGLVWELDEASRAVITVENGLVTALAPGSAFITIYSGDNPEDAVRVSVTVGESEPPPEEEDEPLIYLFESGEISGTLGLDELIEDNSRVMIRHSGGDTQGKAVGMKGSTLRSLVERFGGLPVRLVGELVFCDFPTDTAAWEQAIRALGGSFDDSMLMVQLERTAHAEENEALIQAINPNVNRTSYSVAFSYQVRLNSGAVADVTDQLKGRCGFRLAGSASQHNSWLIWYRPESGQGAIARADYVPVNGYYGYETDLKVGQVYVTAGVIHDTTQIIPDDTPLPGPDVNDETYDYVYEIEGKPLGGITLFSIASDMPGGTGGAAAASLVIGVLLVAGGILLYRRWRSRHRREKTGPKDDWD